MMRPDFRAVHGPIFLRLRLGLQRLWAGGTTHFVFTPTELLARLVPLVPRLRRATPSGGRDCHLGSVLRGIAQRGRADRPRASAVAPVSRHRRNQRTTASCLVSSTRRDGISVD